MSEELYKFIKEYCLNYVNVDKSKTLSTFNTYNILCN